MNDQDRPPLWIAWRDRLHDPEPLSAEDQQALAAFYDELVERLANLFIDTGIAEAHVRFLQQYPERP